MVKIHLYFHGAVLALYLAVTLHNPAQELSTNSAPGNGSDASKQIADVVAEMVQESYHHLDNGELDEALRGVDAALQLDSHNASAYDLRGSIYIRKKLWDRAERDYQEALSIAPTTAVFKYKLAEIKFMQKAYDEARPCFAVLQSDEDLGDLASYKIFLCDLLGAHQERAAAELAVMNKNQENPSYYYANAAMAWAHNKTKEANSWINLAQQNLDSSKTGPYLSALINASDLHSPIATFTTKQGDQYDQAKVFVEDIGLRVSSPKGWVTIPFEQLPDDLSPFPAEVRKQIIAKRQIAPDAGDGIGTLSFTTKQGKEYDQVKVSIVRDGLQVLTPDGWITIPFEQLPDDLSPLPEAVQKQIRTNRQTAPDAGDNTTILSFTTKQGKAYDQVRVSIESDGLQVLTSDGWITIPFEQLPNDLSLFPEEVRKKIAVKREAATDATTKAETLSFITKSGKHYDQVRVSIEDDGLQALTPDGWIAIPYAQLPNDLSPFPVELRKQIVTKRQTVPDATGNASNWLSFTTKKGKQYDQVRVSLEDDGLQVLTSDGWITIPFEQLPDDLSPFPTELQKQISAKQKAHLTQSNAPAQTPQTKKHDGKVKTADSQSNTAFIINSPQPELHPQ